MDRKNERETKEKRKRKSERANVHWSRIERLEKERGTERDGTGKGRRKTRKAMKERKRQKGRRKTQTSPAGGWRLAAPLDVRRVRNYRFSERLARRTTLFES